MFSIIIPTKDEALYLPTLLRSIRAQSLQPKEIIVADAFSKDSTRSMARSFGARVVDGGMPAVGRNRGAEQVEATYLVFLDADVELQNPSFFKQGLGEFIERGLDVASCAAAPLSSKRTDRYLHHAYNWYVRACGSTFAHAAGFCIFVKRSLHEAIGGFDEQISFCEDHDYARRAALVGTFGFLTSVSVPVSTRRLERDGRLKTVARFALAELHLNTIGPIRHNGFRYEFGYKKDILNRPR